MIVLRSETLPIKSQTDIVRVRQAVRESSLQIKFSLIDQTKIVTAASELARNTLDYGLGGTVTLEILEENTKKGLRLTFSDQGPGIPDIKLALTDGYTSGKGLGLGLSGAKRLVNDFELWSQPGEGTRVTVTRWA